MPMRRSLLVLIAFITPILADDVVTLSGKNVSGSITSITSTGITVKTDAGPVLTPMAQVLAVNLRAVKPLDASAKYTDVRLVDDAVFHCKEVAFEGKEVALTLFSGTVLKVPAAIVSLLREAQDRPQSAKFEEITRKRLKIDRIVVLRDGELNVLEGTLGEINVKNKTIQFKSEINANIVDIPLERLHGLVFFRTPAPGADPVCRVLDVDGNMVIATKLAHDGAKLVLTTTQGNELTLPGDVLAKLDFNMGKLTFLSDMEPAKVVEKSGIGLVNRYQQNKNLDGEPIVLGGVIYGKGLSLHAFTELEYNLGGKFKEFKAMLGVDIRTGNDSQAKVAIYCDGMEVYSGVVTPKAVVPLAIDVKNVTTLKIVVSSRNILDLHDHVSFGDARVNQ